jgi:integrase/recombinase XerC
MHQRLPTPTTYQAPPPGPPRKAVEALLGTVAEDQHSKHRTDWAERDRALILTALLAGLRADELCQANVGDIRTTDDGAAVIHVKGKGGKERSVPIEVELLTVIETYLDSRAIRFPQAEKRKAAGNGAGLTRSSGRSPLFVGRGGERITRGTRCSLESSGHSSAPVPMRNPCPEHLCTGSAILTPPNSPAPMSASTH